MKTNEYLNHRMGRRQLLKRAALATGGIAGAAVIGCTEDPEGNGGGLGDGGGGLGDGGGGGGLGDGGGTNGGGLGNGGGTNGGGANGGGLGDGGDETPSPNGG